MIYHQAIRIWVNTFRFTFEIFLMSSFVLLRIGPPTFEEATRSHSPFIDMDKDERHRHIGFRPLYPTYDE